MQLLTLNLKISQERSTTKILMVLNGKDITHKLEMQ